jgi:ATP-dependent protease ClpP protease subunit
MSIRVGYCPRMNDNPYYSIRAAAGFTEIAIYGDIGEGWSDETTASAARLVEQIGKITAKEIRVRINSFGGAVADGLAIFNALRRHPARIAVVIDGAAVSIASLISMAGDTISAAENALLMVHAPWSSVSGNAKDLTEMAAVLDRFAGAMVSAYAPRLGEALARSMLTDGADHWFTATEALAAGLIDEITAPLKLAAAYAIAQAQTRFARMTDPTPTTPTTPTPPTAKPQLALATTTESEVLARLRARNEELGTMFSRFQHREGVPELYARLLADPTAGIEDARQALLRELARDAEPLMGPRGPQAQPLYVPGVGITSGRNSHAAGFRAAAQDALLIRAGLHVKEPHPAARDLRGLSLVQVAAAFNSLNGRQMHDSPLGIVKAAMTTSDFPELLANTAGRALMLGYESEPASHRPWVRDVDVPDFKAQKRIALSAAPGLEEVPEAGEFTYGSLSEGTSLPFSLRTFGKILKISRRAIVNDDLGGFTRLPQAFGASAARLEANHVYALLTGNPNMPDGEPLFSAAHSNSLSATGLDVASLSAARTALRRQHDISGQGLLNVQPSFLIVPAALETAAEVLIASTVDPSKGNATPNATWVRSLILVVDPRLDEASATTWYLAGATSQIDTLELAHLEGERVFVEERDGWSSDDFEIKCRMDFCAALIDHRGLVRSELDENP